MDNRNRNLEAAIDRFEQAVTDFAFIGEIPVFSEDEGEQEAIDAERTDITNAVSNARKELVALYQGGAS